MGLPEALLDFPSDFYYEVGNFKTINKIAALTYANNQINKVKFNFYDATYDKHNWTVEPEQSMHELMDEYIKELRDKYSYVALWYSGGYDSETILQRFIATGTKLDEIVIYKREWQPTTVDFECNNAIEKACAIKQTVYPQLVIREFSYRIQDTIDFYNDYKFNWIYEQSSDVPAFSKVARRHTFVRNPSLSHTLSHKRVDIDGLEKPWLIIKNNDWYLTQPDKPIALHFGSPCLHFYCANPKIQAKQAWLSMKWMERCVADKSLSIVNNDYVQNIQNVNFARFNENNKFKSYYEEWNINLDRCYIHDPTVKINLFKIMLYNNSGIHLPESKPLLSLAFKKYNDAFKVYQDQIINVSKFFGHIWNRRRGFDTIFAKKRFLRKVNSKLNNC